MVINMKNDNGEMGGIIGALVIVIFVLALALCVIVPLFTQDYVTLDVNKKDTYTTTSCSSGGKDGSSSCSTELNRVEQPHLYQW